ncbi:MAG: SHOCT-like domain-containing protein, partial [Omnitrophica WOR_2 bacterium]
KAEQKARFAERHSQGREKRTWGFEWPASRPEAAAEPVSEDERMLILKMLEEKKISAEEAEQLLSALEGKSD